MSFLKISALAILAIVSSLPPAKNAAAFPGPRTPLFQMFNDAEVVVYADVVNATDTADQQRSTLSIAKVLKSGPKELPATITVYTQQGGCPYPHQFKANERVLVFLRFDPKELMYELVSISDAVILCRANELDAYARRFSQLPPILQRKDREQRTAMLVAWCIECVKEPATRGDGVYGLQCLQSHEKERELVDKAQKEGLVRLLVADDPPMPSAEDLIDLLKSYPSRELDRFLLSSLPKCHLPGWFEISVSAVEHLPTRLGVALDPSTKRRLDEYWMFACLDENRGMKLTAEYRRQLDRSWGFICCDVWNQCGKSLRE